MSEILCPKCGSDQITANKRGYSVGKAAAGVVLTGGVGLIAGMHGSKKVDITCLSCGKSWTPQQAAKEKQREASAETLKANQELIKWDKYFMYVYESGDMQAAEKFYNQRYGKNYFISFHDKYAAMKKIQKSNNQFLLIVLGIVALVVALLIVIF